MAVLRLFWGIDFRDFRAFWCCFRCGSIYFWRRQLISGCPCCSGGSAAGLVTVYVSGLLSRWRRRGLLWVLKRVMVQRLPSVQGSNKVPALCLLGLTLVIRRCLQDFGWSCDSPTHSRPTIVPIVGRFNCASETVTDLKDTTFCVACQTKTEIRRRTSAGGWVLCLSTEVVIFDVVVVDKCAACLFSFFCLLPGILYYLLDLLQSLQFNIGCRCSQCGGFAPL